MPPLNTSTLQHWFSLLYIQVRHVSSSLTTGGLRLAPGAQERPCMRCAAPDVSVKSLRVPSSCSSSPASITHHNVTNHSLSRPKGPLIGYFSRLRPSDWWINHFPGLPFADLLHRWSVSPDEKISHHLHSGSRTPAPQFVVWSIGAHSSSTFNIPNSHAHWDWIKMSNKIRILKRFSGVIDIFCSHVLTMSRLLPIFN